MEIEKVCELCGAAIDYGRVACREKILGEVLAREYGMAEYGSVHLLTVDCYALQHPEDHGPRLNAFHLIRLSWLLNHGGNPDIKQKNPGPMQFIMKNYPDFPYIKPPLPKERGGVTVLEVYEAQNAQAHIQAVYRWARSVWDAYKKHHNWVTQMLKKAGVE